MSKQPAELGFSSGVLLASPTSPGGRRSCQRLLVCGSGQTTPEGIWGHWEGSGRLLASIYFIGAVGFLPLLTNQHEASGTR